MYIRSRQSTCIISIIFDSSPSTCKLTGCDDTSFPGSEKHNGDAKDSGKHMADIFLVETDGPQLFSHLCNELENGTILGESTDMYPETIS